MTTELIPPSAAGRGHRAALPGPAGLPGRARSLFLGRPADPRWARPALWAVLVLAAVLYTWNLTSGSENTFYSAAVYSGTRSWKAFFYGALDAGGFITVDKPPFALWVMGLSCRLLGFGTWQMALPMAGAGVASVALLYAMVRRGFGHAAALLAALVLALTPITVAITRDNNPDPVLVLLMLLGAAGTLRAIRTGRAAPLVWAAVAVGFAFLTKMLQGYIALPAMFLAYLLAARASLGRRIRNLAMAGVALVVSSGWWMAIVDAIPAADRPYIGGSTDNTVWNLVIGYNGLGRVLGASAGTGGGGQGANFGGTAGFLRLFNSVMGGQISWLIPFAAVALAGGLVWIGRAPRTDTRRAVLVLFGGWFVVHYLVFSLAEGTFHPYYTTALAPGVAALCGAGGVLLYEAFRSSVRWVWVLPAAVLGSAMWAYALLARATGWNSWLGPVIVALAAAAVSAMLLGRFAVRAAALRAGAVLAAVVALLAGPAAYAASAVTGTGGGMGGTNPTAGPSTGGGMGGPGGFPGGRTGTPPSGAAGGFPGGSSSGSSGGFPGGLPGAEGAQGAVGAPEFAGGGQAGMPGGGTGTRPSGSRPSGGGMGGGGMGGEVSSAMTAYLKKHQDGAEWLLAVSNDQSAASLILSTHQPVISMGGWDGSDPAMTLTRLKQLVAAGRLHYILLGSAGGGGMGGNSKADITAWVQAHGTKVSAAQYGGTSSGASSSASALYRLDPSDIR